MHSPVSRIAATVIFVLALGGVALWFHGGGAGMALADFAQPIIEAKNTTFNRTTEVKGRPPRTDKILVMDSQHMRYEDSSDRRIVVIVDLKRGRHLTLQPKKAKAELYKLDVSTKSAESGTFYFFSDLQTTLRQMQGKPDTKSESLGEKVIGGHRATGYRITRNGRVTELWGDPKTGLPVLVEQTSLSYSMKITMNDFVFNADMDESLFSTEAPSGYRAVQLDTLPGTEDDLLATLRRYSDVNGGVFPDGLDVPATYGRWITKTVEKHKPGGVRSEREYEQELEFLTMSSRAAGFVNKLPPTANARYAGKGVSRRAAKRPIFWYHPTGAKDYRVIFSDLSIREAKTPPRVANAQPVQAKPAPRKPVGGVF